MFRKVPKASAHDSGPEGSRKPRTYASSREFWKLLENAGTWAGAAGADQKLLKCAGELGSAAWFASTVAGTVAANVSRGYLSHPKSGCVTGQRQTYTYASEALTY